MQLAEHARAAQPCASGRGAGTARTPPRPPADARSARASASVTPFISDEAGVRAGEHARHPHRLIGQLPTARQHHAAGLEQRDPRPAGVEVAPARSRAGPGTARCAAAPGRRPSGWPLAAASRRGSSGGQPQPIGQPLVGEGERRPPPTTGSRAARRSPGGAGARRANAADRVGMRRHHGRHLPDAVDPRDLLDQVDLAEGVAGTPGRHPPAAVGRPRSRAASARERRWPS